MAIESALLNKRYFMKFTDGSTWAIPVHVILLNHSEYVASNSGQDPMAALEAETIPYFEEDVSNIEDWAKNNMNWSEISEHAVQITPPSLDFQNEWMTAKVKLA